MPPATNGFRRWVFCNDCGHRGPQKAVGLCPKCHKAETLRVGHLGQSRLTGRTFQDEGCRLGEDVWKTVTGAPAWGGEASVKRR